MPCLIANIYYSPSLNFPLRPENYERFPAKALCKNFEKLLRILIKFRPFLYQTVMCQHMLTFREAKVPWNDFVMTLGMRF